MLLSCHINACLFTSSAAAAAAAAVLADDGLPAESELRAELLALLQGVDLQTVSYKQLHSQLEDKFKVRTWP
jgi:hypothetical protein